MCVCACVFVMIVCFLCVWCGCVWGLLVCFCVSVVEVFEYVCVECCLCVCE